MSRSNTNTNLKFESQLFYIGTDKHLRNGLVIANQLRLLADQLQESEYRVGDDVVLRDNFGHLILSAYVSDPIDDSEAEFVEQDPTFDLLSQTEKLNELLVSNGHSNKLDDLMICLGAELIVCETGGGSLVLIAQTDECPMHLMITDMSGCRLPSLDDWMTG